MHSLKSDPHAMWIRWETTAFIGACGVSALSSSQHRLTRNTSLRPSDENGPTQTRLVSSGDHLCTPRRHNAASRRACCAPCLACQNTSLLLSLHLVGAFEAHILTRYHGLPKYDLIIKSHLWCGGVQWKYLHDPSLAQSPRSWQSASVGSGTRQAVVHAKSEHRHGQ